uniref:Uncharacterized protein n=1 Tax=Tetraselmis sp. GSL018 TaxID=582737 RepID=A0A061S2Y3_9CHLO
MQASGLRNEGTASDPLLRSHFLGFLAMVDAVITTCLVLFDVQGNLWTSLFPADWPSKSALASGMGDILLLLFLRWSMTTSSGSGAGFLLSNTGLILTAILHLFSTLYLFAKVAAALELRAGERGVRMQVAADVFSVAACWLQYGLTLRSLRLLRLQLLQDRGASFRDGGPAAEMQQPLLDLSPTGAQGPPPGGGDPESGGGGDDGGDSECSFRSAASHRTAGSFMSVTSHHTAASSATARRADGLRP